jgi:hypothetical protein
MRRKNKFEKKKTIVWICLLFALSLGIGYAILAEKLELNSSVNYGAMSFDVGFTTAEDGGGSVTSSPSVSTDKKSVTVTCNIGTSTKSETCIAKAKIKNASSFAVQLESNPTITFDNTYINSVEAIWTSNNANVVVGNSLNSNTEEEIMITIITKELTKEMLPETSLSIPITITMNWVQETESEYDNLSILSIGNSFSVDSMEYVYQIAENLGYKNITLGNLYIGGCSLETHLSNARNDSASYTYYTNTTGEWKETNSYKISTAVQSEEWDFITFQQASPNSGQADTYDDLNALINIVQPMSPNSQLAWHMTWAYQSDSTHSGFANYNKDQMTMYNAIVSAVQNKIETNDNIDIIIPVGTAIQNARTSYLGDTLTRDGYHLSYDIGRYIAGVEFLHGLTNIDVSNLKYQPAGVTDNVRKIAIESANNATLNKYKVTQSKYELDGYKRVKLELNKSAYYNSGAFDGGITILPPTLVNAENNPDPYNNHLLFWSTQIFTEETLPVGSIINVASGWKYRPDGWNDDSYNTSETRPGNITTSQVIIDDTFWRDYTYRGFNISNVAQTDLSSLTEEKINSIFQIYVPITN